LPKSRANNPDIPSEQGAALHTERCIDYISGAETFARVLDEAAALIVLLDSARDSRCRLVEDAIGRDR
jgi:hypothetical protein